MMLLAHLVTVTRVLVISCFADSAWAECGEIVWKYCEDRRTTDDSAVDRNMNPIMLGPDGVIYATIPEGAPYEGQYYAGRSNTTLLAIHPTGYLLWRHKLESTYFAHPPVVGRDNTVYVVASTIYDDSFRTDRYDRLYAFAPGGEGKVSWTVDVCYEGEPFPASADTSVFVSCGSANKGIWKVGADGHVIKFKSFFTSDQDPYDVRFRAMVGHTGDIYGIFVRSLSIIDKHTEAEYFNTTVFSLDSDLELKWKAVISNHEDRATWFAPYFIKQRKDSDSLLLDGALYDKPIEGYVFELHIDDDFSDSSPDTTYRKTQDPTVPDERFVPSRMIPPEIGPAGEMYMVESRSRYDGLIALDPDLKYAWSREMSLPSRPVVGADGTVYISVLQKYIGATPVDSYNFSEHFDSIAFLMALDNSSGGIKWKYDRSRASMATEGLTFLGTPCINKRGDVYAVDMLQGCVVALRSARCRETSTTDLSTLTRTTTNWSPTTRGEDELLRFIIIGLCFLLACLVVYFIIWLWRRREVSALQAELSARVSRVHIQQPLLA